MRWSRRSGTTTATRNRSRSTSRPGQARRASTGGVARASRSCCCTAWAARGSRWGPYVEGLAGHDVYAVDTIGDVGRSEQTALIADADDLSRWLDETLAGVGVEHAHLAGTSYGGYLALNLAARSPQRVASITLIDAGGLSPFRLGRFMLWGLPNLLGSKAPGPIRRSMARTRPLLEDPRLMKLALLGQTNHPFGMPPRSSCPTTSSGRSPFRRRS